MENDKKYITANPQSYKAIKEKARSLRLNPTHAEKIAWIMLRNNNLGVKFRRQHIIHNFIVDFVALKYKLVIEIDGSIHDETKEYDGWRDGLLSQLGYRVVRISNEELLSNSKLVQKRLSEMLLEIAATSP